MIKDNVFIRGLRDIYRSVPREDMHPGFWYLVMEMAQSERWNSNEVMDYMLEKDVTNEDREAVDDD